MTPTDGFDAMAAARRTELEQAATRYRQQRAARRTAATSPSPLLRLYARLWWASRPRAGTWGPVPTGPLSA